MFSHRIYTLLNSVHVRRSAVPIYFHSFHTSCNGKHNLVLIKKIGSNILAPSKCSPLYVNSVFSPVRHYSLIDTSDSLGDVRLLRGVRSNFTSEIEVPSPFQCGNYIFNLTKVLNQTSLRAVIDFMAGFEQGFVLYNDLIIKRNPDDLDKEWLLPSAQADSKDIINRLPMDYWEAIGNHGFLVPFCVGYNVNRSEAPPSVDAAILFPCALVINEKKLFWHLVYTRKFGEGVIDSWTIKYVAVYTIN